VSVAGGRAGGASRLIAILLLGTALVALQLRLRGETDLPTQIVGQCTAGVLFIVALLIAWRGLRIGRWGLIVILLFAAGFRAAAFVPADVTPPLSTDIHRYAWDGRVQLEGISPYRYAPNDPELRELRDETIWPGINRPTWKTVYPPAAEAAFAASQFTFGDRLRSTTWLFLIAEAVAIGLLLVVLRRLRAPPERILAYAWHPLAVSEIAGNGHVDALAIVGVAGLVMAWTSRRFLVAGLLAAFATLVKLGPLVVIPALARRGGRRFVAAALGLVVAAYVPYAISVGWGVFGSLRRFEEAERFNGSLDPILRGVVSADVAQAILAAGLLAVITVVAMRRHDTATQVARSLLLVLGGLLIAVDYVQPWHALWLTPLLVIAAAPGWMWLTLALPVGYVAGIDYPPPVWVALIEYVPLGLWAIWLVLRRRRAVPVAPLGADARVAAVIPVLNEEEALGELLRDWPAGVVDEIVVVDGNSSDGTTGVAHAAGARVVVEAEQGYGRACMAGAAATDAAIIVFLDGDGSCDPADIPAVVAPVRSGTAALALGSRRRREASAMPWHQLLGNRVVALAVRLGYGARVSDIPCLRAIRRDTFDGLALTEMTYGWPTQMIVNAARAGAPIVEVPVSFRRRRGGESKVAGKLGPSLRAGARMITVALRDT
jgi:hypothetical protein